MNLAYLIAGIAMFPIALTAWLLAHNVANDCKFFSRFVGQLIFEPAFKNMQNQCLTYIQQEAITLLFIGVIVYSVIGVLSIIAGFKSKGEEQHVKLK